MEEKHPSSRQNGEQQQAEQHQTWRQKIKQYQVAIGVIAIVLVVFITLIIAGYGFDWTGFKGKTVWDWLGLLASLAIPVVVAFGTLWFTTQQGKVSDAANERQHETELQIATDNQREAALQAYIDKISELLLEKNLRESQPEDEARTIARVRTLKALRGLDSVRKGSVLQFLQESGLIKRFDPNPIIVLSNAPDWADLRVADLSWANLQGADLHDADLSGTNLHFADLCQAQLTNADLRLVVSPV